MTSTHRKVPDCTHDANKPKGYFDGCGFTQQWKDLFPLGYLGKDANTIAKYYLVPTTMFEPGINLMKIMMITVKNTGIITQYIVEISCEQVGNTVYFEWQPNRIGVMGIYVFLDVLMYLYALFAAL